MKIVLASFIFCLQQCFGQECNHKWLFQPAPMDRFNEKSNSTACECTEGNCDDFVVNWPKEKDEFLEIQSTQFPVDSEEFPQRFSQSSGELIDASPRESDTLKFTITKQKQQKITGFGGAMTDSSVLLIDRMSQQVQNEILETYFDPIKGNRYTFVRTNMGGCDFSERVYTYLDTYGDFYLKTWHLSSEDTKLKIPMLKKINAMNPRIEGDESTGVDYFFAPWTAPDWMKTNNRPDGKGTLVDDPNYKSTWAKYFIKYLQAYQEEGISFSHFSLQNEPMAGLYTSHQWQETGWNATGENDFLINYIIPELQENGFDDIIVQVLDGQRVFSGSNYANKALEGAEKFLNKGIKGFSVAVHWYSDFAVDKMKRVSGKGLQKMWSKLSRTFGDNFYIHNTEACMPVNSYPPSRSAADDRGNWFHGMRYSEDIIIDLNNHISGWTDWNVVLDLSGGPNWAGNRHDAPIIVDTDTNTYWKNPMFYHMGHFSKFLDRTYTVYKVAGDTDNSDVLIVAANNGTYEVFVILSKYYEKQAVEVVTSQGRVYNSVMEPRSIKTVVVKL